MEGKSGGGAMSVGVEVRIGVAEVGFQESVPIRGVEGVWRVIFAGAGIGGVEIADGREPVRKGLGERFQKKFGVGILGVEIGEYGRPQILVARFG